MPPKVTPNPKPAPVLEVEAGAAASLDDAWSRLEGRKRLAPADIAAWVAACRADRARWMLGEAKKTAKKEAGRRRAIDEAMDGLVGGAEAEER